MMRGLWIALTLFASVTSVFAASAKPKTADDDHFKFSDLLPRGFQKNPKIDLSVYTEFTEEGKKRPIASVANPMYYLLVDGGLTEEGETVAGEKPPKPQALAEVLKTALHGSGYEPATGEHPPQLVIFYKWGVYNHLSSLAAQADGDTDADRVFDLTDPLQAKNLMVRAAMVGGPKFATDMMKALQYHTMSFFQNRDDRTETLVTLAFSDLYFVLAVAYDAQAASQNKKLPLWTTRIATDSQGLEMSETLPALVKNAHDYFGHATDGAVLFHPRIYPGHVEIGEATVTGVDTPAPTPTPTPEPKAKPLSKTGMGGKVKIK